MVSIRFLGLLATARLATASAPELEVVYDLELATQVIAFSANGRCFLMQRYSLTDLPRAVELLNDTTVLYPNAQWNSYNSSDPASDPAKTFVSLDSVRIGLDERYWLVDGGSCGLNGSTELIGINLSNDTVDKLYYLDDIKPSNKRIDNVRFDPSGDVAYLSDTAGALLVLNMTTSAGARLLVIEPTAVAWFPMMYNHTPVPGCGAARSALSVGLDQLEISPDGEYLYYQPCNGGLCKI